MKEVSGFSSWKKIRALTKNNVFPWPTHLPTMTRQNSFLPVKSLVNQKLPRRTKIQSLRWLANGSHHSTRPKYLFPQLENLETTTPAPLISTCAQFRFPTSHYTSHADREDDTAQMSAAHWLRWIMQHSQCRTHSFQRAPATLDHYTIASDRVSSEVGRSFAFSWRLNFAIDK